MPITTLDPVTALIVVDLQQGIVGLPLAHPVAGIIEQCRALIDAFRAVELPVVLVNVEGSPPGRTDQGPAAARSLPEGWSDLIPELDRHPADLLVTKHARSAFAGTGLSERLRQRGVTQVVIVGIATSSGVESTARDAHEHGFHVTLAVDAMTDSRADGHEHSIRTVFPRIAETGETQQVLDALAGLGR